MQRIREYWIRWVREPWVVTRRFDHAIKQQASYIRGYLLDVGCGNKPFQDLFSQSIERYIGLDLPRDPPHCMDIIADAQNIPIATESMDAVLCTHVLVHIMNPQKAVLEMARVLKKDGILLLSARQMWHVYTDQDFYRFTRSGLQLLTENARLEVIHSFGVCGLFARIGAKIIYWLHSLNRKRIRWFTEIPIGLLILVVQALFYCLDRLIPTPKDPVYNIVLAKKIEKNIG